MATATFSTPNVSCMSCMSKIEDALAPLGGVESTDVDVVSHQVQVTYDDSQVQPHTIAEAITGAGYPVTDVVA